MSKDKFSDRLHLAKIDGKSAGFETLLLHAGTAPDPMTGARQFPIYQTTSYVFESAEHAATLFNLQAPGFIYSRLTNPTVAALEERLATLEGGRGSTFCASGHAAQMLAFLPLMKPGDNFIASRCLYGGSITQFGVTFKKFGWECTFVDISDHDAVSKAITPSTKAIFCESLSNPSGIVADIAPLAEIAHKAGIPLIVDNTIATPYLCRPIEYGADIVVHSTTKFLSGHGQAVGGVMVDSGRFDWTISGKFPGLAGPDPAYHGLNFHETFGDLALTVHGHAVGLRDLGAAASPMNAWLTLLGTETLAVRMERHIANAQKVAEFLSTHPQVSWVSYAGLPDSPYHNLAKQYLRKGAGSIFTFGVKGGYHVGVRLVESCELISHLANVGDTRSLILHPASTTHRQLTAEERTAAGAGDDVIRLSIGLETLEDILTDLDRALTRTATKKAAE
ncbi:MAG: O-acetylhomoserine aminocarboxypropyltransferase/cysteine synthase family protein [Alphaproteobacteria bacterium]